MTEKKLISDLRRLIDADFEAGLLFWKERGASDILDLRLRNTWNTRYAGKPALCCVSASGYCSGTFLGKAMLAHRAIFAMRFGYMPHVIDHIDGNKTNNSIDNLRDVDRAQNSRNQKLHKNNTSGVVGVRRRDGRWIAQIKHAGAYRFLGSFSDFEMAVTARREAQEALGFHKNHGRMEVL